MYLILLTYLNGLEPVLQYLDDHRLFLEKYYQKGKFICSGPQVPRNGGVILCKAVGCDEVNALIREDPFYIHQVASYSVIEFEVTKCHPEFIGFA